jgi:multidrug resistance efflux pump
VATTDAATSLAQAEKQNEAAHSLVDTADAAIANVRAAEALLTNALRALEDTEVKAPHDGRVTGLKVSTGEVVAPVPISVYPDQHRRMVCDGEFPRNRSQPREAGQLHNGLLLD